MSNENFKMIAKTFYGFENILCNELLKLGAQKITKGLRSVSFYGDTGFMYKSNLSLRTALKILKPIKEFKFNDLDAYYESIKSIEWEKYMNFDSSFSINSVVFHSKIFNNSKFTSLKAKDAIADRFRSLLGRRPNVNNLNPDIKRFKKYGFNIEIGDQSDPKFWEKFFKKYGEVDIILDDGGHTNYQQILTLNNFTLIKVFNLL